MHRTHLRLIASEYGDETNDLVWKAGRLAGIQIISPVLSVGVALASWVAASFWLFATMIGNPDGTERRDDGRATVLAVRDWWERFLLKAAEQ